jgi:hypothetical protein
MLETVADARRTMAEFLRHLADTFETEATAIEERAAVKVSA